MSHSPLESPAYPESGKPPAEVHSPQEHSALNEAYSESEKPQAKVQSVHPNNPPTTEEYSNPNGADVQKVAEPVVACPDPIHHPQANVSSEAGDPPAASFSASVPPEGYPKSPASSNVKRAPSGCCSSCSIL